MFFMDASLAPGQLHGCASASGGDMKDWDEKFTNMGFHLKEHSSKRDYWLLVQWGEGWDG